MTDRDFQGLSAIADAGLAMKIAEEYGNLPELSVGKMMGLSNPWAQMGADMAAYAIPGVGNAMSAYDAARNFADVFSDLKRGKFLSAAGNLGSGALNTFFAIPGIGTIGKLVAGAGKMGLKAVGMAGKASRMARMAGKAVDVGGKISRYGANLAGKYPIPKFRHVMAGQLASTGLSMYDDARYDRSHYGTQDERYDRAMGSHYESRYPEFGGYMSSVPYGGQWGGGRPSTGPYGNPYGVDGNGPYA